MIGSSDHLLPKDERSIVENTSQFFRHLG